MRSWAAADVYKRQTQAGIPDMIPAQACVLGWQESLTMLAQLVEAEIPDQM